MYQKWAIYICSPLVISDPVDEASFMITPNEIKTQFNHNNVLQAALNQTYFSILYGPYNVLQQLCW